jgi:predicted SAM-dependent methyltransferase
MKIELGCGPNHDRAYFGIDVCPHPGVDLVWDLEQVPLPLGDACCEEIRCSHVLEHVRNLIPLLNECQRLLVPGGTLMAVVPQACDLAGHWHATAFQDPTHVRFFVPATWDYFVHDRQLFHFGQLYGVVPWDMVDFVDEGWQATAVLRKPAS